MFLNPVAPSPQIEVEFDLPALARLRPTWPEPEFIEPREPLLAHHLAAGQLYRLADGCIALYRQLDSERRQILDILGPGRLIDAGLMERMQCQAVAFVATCLEPVAAPADQLAAMAEQNRQLMLSRALGHLTRLGKQSAGERVAATLLDLAAQFGPESPDSFSLHLSRNDMADWLGLTLETVSRCMSRLRQDGLIDMGKEGAMSILDRAALVEVARGERKLESIYAVRRR